MLIHGLWMTPKSWENFKERFQWLGYNVTCIGPFGGLMSSRRFKTVCQFVV